jgi:putative ATP-binding cassette transporter
MISNALKNSALVQEVLKNKDKAKKILVMMNASGLLNGIMIWVILVGAVAATKDELKLQYVLIFAVALVGFVWTRRLSTRLSLELSEGVLTDLRLRLVELLSKTDLDSFQKVGSSRVLSSLGSNTMIISQVSMQLASAVPSAVMLLAIIVLSAFISFPALLLFLGFVLISFIFYRLSMGTVYANWDKTLQQENHFYFLLNHFLDGFKELKLDSKKRKDLHLNFLQTSSKEAEELKVRTGSQFSNSNIILMSFFYMLLAIVIFILPRFIDLSTDSIIQLCGIVLFTSTPFSEILSSISNLSRMESSVASIHALEAELKAFQEENGQDISTESREEPFTSLECKDLKFTFYDNGSLSFVLGPIKLQHQ